MLFCVARWYRDVAWDGNQHANGQMHPTYGSACIGNETLWTTSC